MSAQDCSILAEKLNQFGEHSPQLLVLPMYNQLPFDFPSNICDAADDGNRKCIVSTNVAETSLTVGEINYVIDAGFVSSRYVFSSVCLQYEACAFRKVIAIFLFFLHLTVAHFCVFMRAGIESQDWYEFAPRNPNKPSQC